jgi:HK97 family phage portal protein
VSVLVRAFGRDRRSVAPFDPSALALPSPAGSGMGVASATGRPVDTDTALSIMTFYRGVQLIADSIALLPLQAVRQLPDKTREPVGEKPGVIVNPFLGVSLQEGVSQILTSLIIRGNAYLFPGRVVGNEVLQWRIVSPDSVSVRWAEDGSVREYRIGGQLYPDARFVTHLTGFMMPGSATGAGLLEYCRNSLGLTVALTESAGTLFANGVMSSGIISMDQPMDDGQARSVADQFRQNHAGVKKAHAPIVLGGGATYTPISITPDDAQFLQSRQFQQGEIATMLGIPPHLLGIVDRTTSWGTGIEVQGRAFVDYTLRAYIQRLQTMFTGWLDEGVWAEYDTDSLTRAETATRFDNYTKAIGAGILNVDEARAREGLRALPGGLGQTYYQSTLWIPAGQAAAAPVPTENPNTDTSTPTTSGAN